MADAQKLRGCLSIWFDPRMLWRGAPMGRRGWQREFRDTAIQVCLMMKVLFGILFRQTTGFVESFSRLPR
ncbi:hypothetical protein FEV53_12880 [Palleronia caenipelagi]|uniref:Transposase DDE domain-containing protein n=1 Tax=Palleronia caenipelagi TaxID=2489174 RepID=A0A547PT57_9RHOB|nr:hypothetical protein FEV53_12880 [Palleronia caenipelagi]